MYTITPYLSLSLSLPLSLPLYPYSGVLLLLLLVYTCRVRATPHLGSMIIPMHVCMYIRSTYCVLLFAAGTALRKPSTEQRCEFPFVNRADNQVEESGNQYHSSNRLLEKQTMIP